jgi:hypothetical protein
MSLEHSPQRQRRAKRFGRIPEAVTYGAISRSTLYEWRRERPELFRKNGDSTIVDFDVLDQILDSLRVAKLNPES